MAINRTSSPDSFNFNPDDLDQGVESGGIVPIGGELPFNIQIQTSKLLDILTSLSPGFQQLNYKGNYSA